MAESESDPSEDTKRKFREALERKKAKAAGGADQKGIGGKQVRAHGVVSWAGRQPPLGARTVPLAFRKPGVA
jgi:hypothetical protein